MLDDRWRRKDVCAEGRRVNASTPAEPSETRNRPTGKGLWRPVVLLAAVVAIAVAARAFGIGGTLEDLSERINALGPVGPIVFILLRAGAAVAVIPGSALSAAGGVLFGPVTGVICVSAGKTLGACVSFLIARRFARQAVARWLSTKEKYGRLDELMADHGALVVALLRLLPVIPFNVQNYGFGLSRIRFGTYLFWSWLCMLPGAVLVVVGMGIIRQTLARGEVPWTLVGVLASTVVIMLGLGAYSLLKLRATRRSARNGP